MKKHTLITVILVLSLLLCNFPIVAETTENYVVAPFLSKMITAELYDYVVEDNLFTLYYSSATEEDLLYYLTVCSFNGLYSRRIENEYILYALYSPEKGYVGAVTFQPDTQSMNVYYLYFDIPVYEENIEPLVDFVANTEIRLPDTASNNIAPQFYAIAGCNPDHQGQAASSSIFDNNRCWTETYSGITFDTLKRYTVFMKLFGFDVEILDYFDSSVLGEPVSRLLFFNGDAEIIVEYLPVSGRAWVFYEPGVSYYLLNTTDLNKALGN